MRGKEERRVALRGPTKVMRRRISGRIRLCFDNPSGNETAFALVHENIADQRARKRDGLYR